MKARMLSARQAATARNVCPGCGAEILPRVTPKGAHWIAAWCSKTCARRARMRPMPEQPCRHCGAMFRLDPRGTRKRPRIYCSQRCAGNDKRNPEGWIRKRRGGYPVFWTGKAEVLVHRIVMEGKLGRPLRDTETVHHINGDRGDWRAENLELWDHAQPHGQRVPDKIAWCIEYLGLHGYAVTPTG